MLAVAIISYMEIQKVNMDLILDFITQYSNFLTQKTKLLKTKNSLFLIKLPHIKCLLVHSQVKSIHLEELNHIRKI